MRRNDGETWLECALRYASKYSLEYEVEIMYWQFKSAGETDQDAALWAAVEWDVLEAPE